MLSTLFVLNLRERERERERFGKPTPYPEQTYHVEFKRGSEIGGLEWHNSEEPKGQQAEAQRRQKGRVYRKLEWPKGLLISKGTL